jgi:hypothetical protein
MRRRCPSSCFTQDVHMWILGSQVCGPNRRGCASASTKVEDLKTVSTRDLWHSSRELIFFIVSTCNFSKFYLFMFNRFRGLNSVLSNILQREVVAPSSMQPVKPLTLQTPRCLEECRKFEKRNNAIKPVSHSKEEQSTHAQATPWEVLLTETQWDS